MAVELGKHQLIAVEKLGNGKILCGDVGSGKSRAAIAYFFIKECDGMVKINGQGSAKTPTKPHDLYIITTAKKRNSLDWEGEAADFMLSRDRTASICGIKVTVDSWNNIAKYKDVKDAFFIFDEQRLVGSGAWVRAFIGIAKCNRWILLSATPGDTWLDYIPVFVANGYYRNRTEFKQLHVVYRYGSKFPQVQRYVAEKRLRRLRDGLLVEMPVARHTTRHSTYRFVGYDKDLFRRVLVDRWNPFDNIPVTDVGDLFRLMRRVANTDASRMVAVGELCREHQRAIIFYNFNYELEALRTLSASLGVPVAEWNGHKHEEVPTGDRWVYLVQYTAGAEGWNCITTDTIVFYSLNYSYKLMEQAKGRIDRLNTPYFDLYYFILRSSAPIDVAIMKALNHKKTFNESGWAKKMAA